MIYHYDPQSPLTAGTLGELGFDLSYHPEYMNRERSMHGVDVVLLSCVLEGSGWHYLGEDCFHEDGSSVSVVSYGQLHDIVTDGPMSVMNLFIDPSQHPLPRMPGVLQSVLPQIISLHPGLANRTNRVVRVPMTAPEAVRGLLLALYREVHGKSYGFHDAARHLFAAFLVRLCREATENGLIRAEQDSRLERVREILDSRYAERLRLDELADEAGMSVSHLCRTFRRHAGRTVFTYLLDRRLEAAMLRLRQTDEKIAVIAVESGFTDLGFFNRTFKARLGLTPRAYRAASARGNAPPGPAG